MINGVNTMDFNFAKDSKPTTISTALPQARSELITVFQYAYAKPELTMSARNLMKTNEMEPPSGLERVHVQRLQTHTQLRNNKWTYQNFYSNAATTAAMDTTAIDATFKTQYNHNNNSNKINNNNNNNINTTNNNNNNLKKIIIENKSALNKCNNDEQLRQQQIQQQQQLSKPQQQQQQQPQFYTNIAQNVRVEEPKQNFSDNFMITSDDKIITLVDVDNGNARPNYYRTKDQENAFRRIEDVHNYAKLKRYGNSNESSDGSTRDFDDDDDDDEEDDDEDVEADDDDNIERNIGVPIVLANNDLNLKMPKNFENAEKNHVVSAGAGYLQAKSILAKNYIRTPSKSLSIEDTDAIVDVETVAGESEQPLMHSPPAHHARRPMNAFLIFCKRHRAIVKDRYKSLENRAITKILGDWWASLDGDEKECFTKLAQQNKDAFFSAHPNFKWYKLPAPPLRTLSTRPSNAERAFEDNDQHEEPTTDELPKTYAKKQAGGFFKLADETQMGELNSLMNDERNTKNECPLQKALGETTHFLSAHIPSNIEDNANTDQGLNSKQNNNNNKRRAIIENGFSSNSSEDDQLPKKSSRSCKGKIYQELVSSGQIAPIAKKTRLTKAANFANEFQGVGDLNYASMHSNAAAHEGFNATSYLHAMDIRNNKAKRTVSESDALHNNFGEHIEHFDLEEKIKQLPALSLDAYLQRKRNTKKKKKFTARKRTSNSVSLPITNHQRPLIMQAVAPKSEIRNYVQQQQAVGSQKRKARKESITRRDVSTIESEVASLMPTAANYELPNGHYYFNEKPIEMNATIDGSLPAMASNENASTNSGDLTSVYSSNYADSITTTSDLFILAEVAAKRTELTNSN